MGEILRKPSLKRKLASRWGVGLLLVGFLLGTFFPSFVQAAPKTAPVLDVIINEVAWAGTVSYFGHEWIELYNSGPVDVDIDGWTLVTKSTSVEIIIDPDDDPDTPTIIPAGEYFLLERNNGGATSVTEDMVYESGFLSDEGEILLLIDKDFVTRDTANLDSDGGEWSHGLISPASSMERMSTNEDAENNWVTNINPHDNVTDVGGAPIYGTPREKNWGYDVSYTPIPPPPPNPTRMSLIINEVGWGGTSADSKHEWIELHNPGEYPIDLDTGWKLRTSNGAVNIILKGTIEPAGTDESYFLLERGTDNVILGIDADQVYDEDDELSDTGAYLQLISPNGVVIDTANRNGGGWDAGEGTPNFYSMERIGLSVDSSTAWMTNVGIYQNGEDFTHQPINGTPGKPNWSTIVKPTPTPLPTRTPILPTRTPTPYPFQSIVLNEVLPRPGHDWNQDGVVDMGDEFIEIINRGEYAVSLNGWKLDDEYNLGSSPYTLPNVALGPGERIAIFGYTSHISLSDGGDTVRLLKSNGEVADAVTYTIIKAADQSWCRLPENGFWNPECFPTPNEENAGLGVFPAFTEENVRSSCFVPDTAPKEILMIECGLLGMSIYDREFWEYPQPIYWVMGQSKYSTWFR